MSEFHGIRLSLGDAASTIQLLKEYLTLLGEGDDEDVFNEKSPHIIDLVNRIDAEYTSAL